MKGFDDSASSVWTLVYQKGFGVSSVTECVCMVKGFGVLSACVVVYVKGFGVLSVCMVVHERVWGFECLYSGVCRRVWVLSVCTVLCET